jgi:predicted permease
MDRLIQDIQYAIRRMAKSPGFTTIAVLSLALGIGANTAIFSIVNSILLSGVPMRAPEELVEIYTSEEDHGYPYSVFAYPDFVDVRERTDLFSAVAAHEGFFSRLETDDATDPVWGELVSHDLFSMLGIEPALGRFFVPEEGETLGTHPVVVLGHGFWQRRYGGDPGIIGQSIRLGGHSFTVVGVGPEGLQSFTAPGFNMDMWVPYMMSQALDSDRAGGRDLLNTRTDRSLFVKGRLRPGVTVEQARAALATMAAQQREAYPEAFRGREFNILPTGEVAIHPLVDGALFSVAGLLLTVVGLVLLIACTNLAGFLLARASERKKEIALRLALGARRGALVRQLLTETVLLSLLGGGAGLLVAHWVLQALMSFQPPVPIPINLNVGLDGKVLLFTLAISTAAGIFFGLFPALQSTNPDVAPTLKDDSGSGTGKRKRFSVRNALIVAQVTISMILLLGAGLFVRSLQGAQDLDLGFSLREAGLIWVMMSASDVERDEWEHLAVRMEERARAIPGVEGVATAEIMPLGVGFQSRGFDIPGIEPPEGDDHHEIPFNIVSPGYFDVMEIPIVAGRGIAPEDTRASTPVMVVSETLARRYWPGDDPIGKEIITPSDERAHQIVGVAKDTKVWTLGEEYRPYIYTARAQSNASSLFVVARGGVSEAQIVGELRRMVRELDSRLVVMDSKTMTEHLSVMLFPPRMAALLLGVFGSLALVLASTGLYGIVAFSVSRRTREMGIRISLGADARTVIGMVLRGALALVAVGGVVGLLLTLGLAQLIGGFLYGVSGTDPVTFIGVPLILGLVATVAALVPARRASLVNPVEALRRE